MANKDDYGEAFKRILEASRTSSLVFFVGAGVSRLSEAPSWSDIIEMMKKELNLSGDSSSDYLKIAQMFYDNSTSEEEYYEKIEKLFKKDMKPNDIHTEMLNLNPVAFITTNYDTLIEDVAMEQCQHFIVVSQDEDITEIRGNRYILKMHGDFKNKNIVLKESDYLSYSDNFACIENMIKTMFLTNTVVFIGYSLNDYNVKLILNKLKLLLNEEFKRPIFVRTEITSPISEKERNYYQSIGVDVIECLDLLSETKAKIEYLELYEKFFNHLKEPIKIGSFYELLRPLDKLDALRKSDIQSRLNLYAWVGENGKIIFYKEYAWIAEEFIKKVKMMSNSQEKCEFEEDKVILSVLKKARISGVEITEGHSIDIDLSTCDFADSLCIKNDYLKMNKFVQNECNSLKEKYKKAFYLFKLEQYEDSFHFFEEVAIEAFKKEEYLTYYFAKSNLIYLEKLIGVSSIGTEVLELRNENLFSELPFNIKSDYKSLKDSHNSNMLYRYFYEVTLISKKLADATDRGKTELGNTNSKKVKSKLKDFLHFIFGNGIIVDEFQECNEAIKNIMDSLIYAYSNQNPELLKIREKLRQKENADTLVRDVICFDEVHFFCLVNCFKPKEIQALFKKYDIKNKKLFFDNLEEIVNSIKNLIDYYDFLLKEHPEKNIENLNDKIKVAFEIIDHIENFSNKNEEVEALRKRFCVLFSVNNIE